MNQTSTAPSLLHRLRDRISQSRYFTISLLLHTGLLIAAGTIVLVTQRAPEMIPYGVAIDPSNAPQRPEPLPDDIRPPERTTLKTSESPEKPLERQSVAGGGAVNMQGPVSVVITKVEIPTKFTVQVEQQVSPAA